MAATASTLGNGGTLINLSSITGGNGGEGGSGGGFGGNGGNGVSLSGNGGSVTNNGTITGRHGGAFGPTARACGSAAVTTAAPVDLAHRQRRQPDCGNNG